MPGNHFKISLVAGALAAAFFLLPGWALGKTHDVTVENNRFEPAHLIIEVGDTVRWTNNTGNFHDVTADDGSFGSATARNFVFEHTFMSVAEVIRYYCSVHSSPGQDVLQFMNGEIHVVEASGTAEVGIESIDAADGATEAGEDININLVLKNNGDGDSGPFNVNFYISTDNEITTADTLLESHAVSDISAGASETIEEGVNLPANLVNGDYFIGAIIDLDDGQAANDSAVDGESVFVFTGFVINAGLNDAWYDPSTDGQGFFIVVFPELGVVSLAWFTYDTELPAQDATANLGDPGHRWMTGAGPFADDEAVMNIVMTSGGLFDTPTEIQRTEPAGSDGMLTLKFDNCNSGMISYDIPSIDASGDVPIQRVAIDNKALCDAFLREMLMPQ